MYAVIETGGKQYRVTPGDTLLVEKLPQKAGETITFDKVLLLVDGTDVALGTPYLVGKNITAKVLSQERGEKIRVSKFKAKVRYRRTTGHRQYLTKVVIDKINTAQPASKAPDTANKMRTKSKSKPKLTS